MSKADNRHLAKSVYFCTGIYSKTYKEMKKTKVLTMSFVSLIISMASCKETPQAPQRAECKTMNVRTSDKMFTTPYSATIRGRQDIDIFPQVSGKIERLCVTEGQPVTRGQLLFVVDQVPYKAAYKTAEANLEAARAALRTAELNYLNGKVLKEKNVVSQSSFKTTENAWLSAKAQVAQADAQLLNAHNNLSYTEVKAPCSGVVGTLPYRVGALVGPSMPQPLTTVSDNSKMYVYFSMTENQVLAMTRQYGSMDKAIKEMPDVELKLNDGTIYEKRGRIESISGVIDRQTGAVTARAVFDNAQGLLHSGASGTILFPSTYKNVIVIPQSATVHMQDKILVYRVVDGTAKSKLIKVAEVNDGRDYVLLEGLSKGDVIVTEGAGLVRDGERVK